jgi:catechol 2,3-dioxygenase-like lactoylglutathione lyase family enzyme
MSDPPPATSAASPVRFECVVPILRVSDLRASLRWYGAVLGFSVDWQSGADPARPTIASASRDGCAVMLCEQDQGSGPAWAWFGVGDVVPLHDELCSKGADVLLPPTSFSWAYEMRVEDPDGNVLRFGSEPRADLPFQDAAAARASALLDDGCPSG